MRWTDIPGVTKADGQLRLPCRPAVVVHLLAIAVEGTRDGGIRQPELVERVLRDTSDPRPRIEGLAGWLPLSRVAAWDADTGELVLDAATDVQDLAMRYAAWVGAQPIPPTHLDVVKAYARAVIEEAALVAQATPALGRAADPPARRNEPKRVQRPPEAMPGEDPLVDPALTARIRRVLAALDTAFLERRPHTRAALLALLAGQHVLLLGPPGTGKSMLARALCSAFRTAPPGSAPGARAIYFEYLLSKFTHPDELFGPVSIPGLKTEDYRRLTEGYLPRAHVAFLDEIFKANSAILNSLLTLVNERVFHHGRHRDAVPLLGLVGASNELPDPEGGLGALYDRFLVRLVVPPLGDDAAFLAVATGTIAAPDIPEADTIGPEDLAALRAAAERVEVPSEVGEALVRLWRRASERDWGVSDRRWRHAVAMLRLGAAADGRRRLIALDLLLLEPVLAPDAERMLEVREAILENLGARAVPSHDLRAQWTLLHIDKVAPTPGHAKLARTGTSWGDRMARRHTHASRFLEHHAEAVARLAADRERLEAEGDRHIWLDRLPIQLLSAHIEAARDLGSLLGVAESYRDALESPAQVVRALLLGLPQGSRRVYGHDAVCSLEVPEAGVHVGLTLAGECVPLTEGDAAARGVVLPSGPVLRVEPATFLDWVDGKVGTEALLAKVPAWSARNAATALESVRRLLGGDVIPRAPELPAPSAPQNSR